MGRISGKTAFPTHRHDQEDSSADTATVWSKQGASGIGGVPYKASGLKARWRRQTFWTPKLQILKGNHSFKNRNIVKFVFGFVLFFSFSCLFFLSSFFISIVSIFILHILSFLSPFLLSFIFVTFVYFCKCAFYSVTVSFISFLSSIFQIFLLAFSYY